MFALITIFEFVLVFVTILAIFNEDKLIAFEKRLYSNFRRRKLKVVKSSVSSSSKTSLYTVNY